MRVVATIEARMTSSRLPGKVMLMALDQPMIGHLISRLKAVPSIDEIVVATTKNAADDVLADYSVRQGANVFRGSEEDVMSRVVCAAEAAGADIVVQITGDCPILDPDLVEQLIRVFKRNINVDFASNAFISSYPDGMDVTVLKFSALKASLEMTNDPLDREHVTRHIVNHPELFRHIYLLAPPSQEWPGLGLTLDEPQDYELLKKLIEHFGKQNPLFGCTEVLKALRQHPEWVRINSKVLRKDPRPK